MSRVAPSLRWPEWMARVVLDTIEPDDVVRDALETQESHTFEGVEAPALVWLVRTDQALVLVAGLDTGEVWSESLVPGDVEISLERGFFKDAVRVGDRVFALGRGQGKRAGVFLEPWLVERAEVEVMPLPRLGRMWFEEPSDEMRHWLKAHLRDAEAVMGLLQATGAGEDADTSVWFLVTDTRTMRVTFQGERAFVVQDEGLVCEPSSLGRDRYVSDRGQVRMLGPRVGGADLRRLVSLGAMSPGRRLLVAGRIHGEEKAWPEAEALLARAEEVREPGEVLEDEDEELTLAERVLLRRAQVSFMLGEQERTIELLRRLTEVRPEDDLMALTQGVSGEGTSWWMLLAMAHEEAGDYASAARVYTRMSEEEGADVVFVLQAARCLQMSGAQEQALETYQRFVEMSLSAQDFGLISYYNAQAHELEASAVDPDLAAACLELGALQEERGELSEAAETYLMLVRQAPFLREGYERLYALRDRLEDRDREVVAQAMLVCRLLNPGRYRELVDEEVEASERAALPAAYEKLDDEAHGAWVVHPSEQATMTLAQKWLGGLVASEQDTADIERHCQRVDARTFPEVEALLVHVSRLCGVPTPRCYLSHGFTGIQVLGREREPFLLLGAAHLDAEHTQYLTTAQMCFALATQVEHIRADHLVLTSSEFWTAFRGRSLDGLVTVLSLIPIGGVLGKLTEGWASGLLARIKTSLDNAVTQKILGYMEQSLKEGAAQDGIQGAYEATLGRLFARDERRLDSDSLLKEQLADFARGAMYTSDRLGLIACDRLEDAVLAILALSARTSAEVGTLREYGLEELLGRRNPDGELVYAELALRLGELFKFALSPEYFEMRGRVFAHT